MTAIVTYEGFTLYDCGRGWKSLIDNKWIAFDTAGQWKQYIDLIKRK